MQRWLCLIVCLTIWHNGIDASGVSWRNPFEKDHVIEGCECDVERVVSHSAELETLLEHLTTKTFFRFFKVDLYRECPYWAMNVMCEMDGVGGCSACECDEDEIPLPWKIETTNQLSMKPLPSDFQTWDDIDDNMWCDCEDRPEVSYVNLLDNVEGNTGYKGPDAKRIWDAIYQENCFTKPLDEMCFEEKVFFKLMSGLHTSITAHIFGRFKYDQENESWVGAPHIWDKVMGKFPERVENLYFTLLFELRALHKLAPFLRNYEFETGNPEEDLLTKQHMDELLDFELLCEPNFDDTRFAPDEENLKLVMHKFRNVSMIMNCIGCERCKIWGKLGVLGLGTALKIMMTEEHDIAQCTNFHIQRNEIIALINSIHSLSESVTFINQFHDPVVREAAMKRLDQLQPPKPPSSSSPPSPSESMLRVSTAKEESSPSKLPFLSSRDEL